MRTLFLTLLLLAKQVAANENSSTDQEDDTLEADEEIIVLEESEIQRRRNQLDVNLRKTGYREGIRRNDKVLYRPEVVWKPTLVVYDSGYVELRKTPPRFEPWVKGKKDNKWRYLSCLPPFTPMCIRASGWLITKRRAQHSKTDVIEHLGKAGQAIPNCIFM